MQMELSESSITELTLLKVGQDFLKKYSTSWMMLLNEILLYSE